MPRVEKSTKAKERHQRVAEQFEKWLKRNPKANRRRRVEMLDAISDSALLEEELKHIGRETTRSSA
jgi:hypothetical protein